MFASLLALVFTAAVTGSCADQEDIWHMMIDRACQGRGYGRKALEKCLEYIRSKPFGDSNRVALTCHEDNRAALGMYCDMGFLPTGQRDDEEIELVLELTT